MDKLPILKIDPEFKDLIRPLRRKEYLQLEENILDEGCRDPIIIWNDYIKHRNKWIYNTGTSFKWRCYRASNNA